MYERTYVPVRFLIYNQSILYLLYSIICRPCVTLPSHIHAHLHTAHGRTNNILTRRVHVSFCTHLSFAVSLGLGLRLGLAYPFIDYAVIFIFLSLPCLPQTSEVRAATRGAPLREAEDARRRHGSQGGREGMRGAQKNGPGRAKKLGRARAQCPKPCPDDRTGDTARLRNLTMRSTTLSRKMKTSFVCNCSMQTILVFLGQSRHTGTRVHIYIPGMRACCRFTIYSKCSAFEKRHEACTLATRPPTETEQHVPQAYHGK